MVRGISSFCSELEHSSLIIVFLLIPNSNQQNSRLRSIISAYHSYGFRSKSLIVEIKSFLIKNKTLGSEAVMESNFNNTSRRKMSTVEGYKWCTADYFSFVTYFEISILLIADRRILCARDGDMSTNNKRRGASSSSCAVPGVPALVNVPTAMSADLASLFECPVCFDYVLPPILQCQSGHLVCSSCRPKLSYCKFYEHAMPS